MAQGSPDRRYRQWPKKDITFFGQWRREFLIGDAAHGQKKVMSLFSASGAGGPGGRFGLSPANDHELMFGQWRREFLIGRIPPVAKEIPLIKFCFGQWRREFLIRELASGQKTSLMVARGPQIIMNTFLASGAGNS